MAESKRLQYKTPPTTAEEKLAEVLKAHVTNPDHFVAALARYGLHLVTDPEPATVAMARADLVQIREALVTAVVSVAQGAVEEVNRAITIADLVLDLDSPMTRNGVTLADARRPTTLTMAVPRTVVDTHG